MYHIKKNHKEALCGKKFAKHEIAITATSAYYSTLTQCCPICKEHLLSQLDLIKKTIVQDE
ncbi:MAG: hypothetical protein WC389_09140 [Lutibacter sp.]|jgi:hypothetical protein